MEVRLVEGDEAVETSEAVDSLSVSLFSIGNTTKKFSALISL